MPPCKNDPARRYVGTEPSPKGLGWCAHAATPGVMATGKDGRSWIVVTDKDGVKSWKPAPKGPVPSREPMTVPRAAALLSVDPDEASVVALKVAHLKAVADFRRKYPGGVNYGYEPVDIHKAYRHLLVRMSSRGVAPKSFGRYVLGRGRLPAEYDRAVKQAVRKSRGLKRRGWSR